MDWQPISTAPKDGTRILGLWLWKGVSDNHGSESHEVVRWSWSGWDADGYARPAPTHWLPLPPPPYATKADSDGDDGA